MVSCAAGEPDAGAAEYADGCVWADGDDQADERAGGAFVCLSFPFHSHPRNPSSASSLRVDSGAKSSIYSMTDSW